jgi:hypothetical protein
MNGVVFNNVCMDIVIGRRLAVHSPWSEPPLDRQRASVSPLTLLQTARLSLANDLGQRLLRLLAVARRRRTHAADAEAVWARSPLSHRGFCGLRGRLESLFPRPVGRGQCGQLWPRRQRPPAPLVPLWGRFASAWIGAVSSVPAAAAARRESR